jgi:hypothetical protein
MARLPEPDQPYDMIWAEGSAYLIGVVRAPWSAADVARSEWVKPSVKRSPNYLNRARCGVRRFLDWLGLKY